MVSPNEPGWLVRAQNPGRVIFGKEGDLKGETKVFVALIIQTDGSKSNSSFLAEAKRSKSFNDNTTRYKNQKVQTQQITDKGTRCLKYVGSVQDTQSKAVASGPQYIKNSGYVCRHPLRKDIAVDMSYSNRSTARTLSAAERNLVKQFFANVQFNNNGF